MLTNSRGVAKVVFRLSLQPFKSPAKVVVKISSVAAYVVYLNSSRPAKFVLWSSRGAAEVVFRITSVTAQIGLCPAFGGPKILV